MKYVIQFVIILIFSFAGELLNHFLPLPVPASIYGLVLLFLALEFKLIPHRAVSDVSHFLIDIMPIMFIPAAVGLMNAWGLVSGNIVQYVSLVLISTILVMAVSALITQFIIRRGGRHHG